MMQYVIADATPKSALAVNIQPCKRRHTAHRCYSIPILATAQPMQVTELAEGLEAPVQLVYLVTLLGFLVVGAYLVVRQVYLSTVQPSFC